MRAFCAAVSAVKGGSGGRSMGLSSILGKTSGRPPGSRLDPFEFNLVSCQPAALPATKEPPDAEASRPSALRLFADRQAARLQLAGRPAARLLHRAQHRAF